MSNTSFIDQLNTTLDKLFLLKHAYYQAWNAGQLSIEDLQLYAQEYYHHVAAFPRYISQIHTHCEDINARQILLGNLREEEEGPNNHPFLWKNFAHGLGVAADLDKQSPILESTRNLVQGYFDLVKTDYATGLGALYAYERQTPLVAGSKIDGLQKNYNITDAKTLEFFSVHQKADEWHTQEIASLIENLNEKERDKVIEGAQKGAELLWKFLDGVMEKLDIEMMCH